MRPGCDLDSGQCRREIVGARFDRLGNRYAQVPLAVEDALSTENGQSDNVLAAQRVAQDMSLGRLLALSLLGLPDMQIEHVAAGVIVGIVERDVT